MVQAESVCRPTPLAKLCNLFENAPISVPYFILNASCICLFMSFTVPYRFVAVAWRRWRRVRAAVRLCGCRRTVVRKCRRIVLCRPPNMRMVVVKRAYGGRQTCVWRSTNHNFFGCLWRLCGCFALTLRLSCNDIMACFCR